MTGAVALSLSLDKGKTVTSILKSIGRKYPLAGYGGMFYHWLFGNEQRPYYSCGNGAAMRVSAVGWVAKSEKEVKELSKRVTEVTHNHPEGLKGAEVTAMCVFKALHGASKEELRNYIVSQYPEVSVLNYELLRATFKHEEETCQKTVPQALYCFLISNSFEDCLRTTISIGGDCDTTSAISCAIAEAFYGIPEDFKREILRYFTPRDRKVLLRGINEIYKSCGLENYLPL